MSEAVDYLWNEHAHFFELASWIREAVLEADPDLAERIYTGWRTGVRMSAT